MLASIRPDSWNLPLFVHVLGAMILVGGLLVDDDRACSSPAATRACCGSAR